MADFGGGGFNPISGGVENTIYYLFLYMYIWKYLLTGGGRGSTPPTYKHKYLCEKMGWLGLRGFWSEQIFTNSKVGKTGEVKFGMFFWQHAIKNLEENLHSLNYLNSRKFFRKKSLDYWIIQFIIGKFRRLKTAIYSSITAVHPINNNLH